MKTHSPTKSRVALVNVSMPTPLRDRLTKKVRQLGSYGSTSDYVRDLIRRDLDHDEVTDEIDQLLIDGLNSGPLVPMTAAWRRARRTALAKHVRNRGRKTERS